MFNRIHRAFVNSEYKCPISAAFVGGALQRPLPKDISRVKPDDHGLWWPSHFCPPPALAPSRLSGPLDTRPPQPCHRRSQSPTLGGVCLPAQRCPTLCPRGIYPARLLHPWVFQARILESVVISYSRGSSWPRGASVSWSGRWFLTTAPPGTGRPAVSGYKLSLTWVCLLPLAALSPLANHWVFVEDRCL